MALYDLIGHTVTKMVDYLLIAQTRPKCRLLQFIAKVPCGLFGKLPEGVKLVQTSLHAAAKSLAQNFHQFIKVHALEIRTIEIVPGLPF